MNLRFGDIFWVPKKSNNPSLGHWIVVLCDDSTSKKVLYQRLASSLYKVFPKYLNSIIKEYNSSFINSIEHAIFNKFINNGFSLCIDELVILNYKSYKFLSKDTYVYINEKNKEDDFIFKDNVNKKKYISCGSLTNNAKWNFVVTVQHSKNYNSKEKKKISDFYKLTR